MQFIHSIVSTGTLSSGLTGKYIDTRVVPGSSKFSITMRGRTLAALTDENWFTTVNYSKPSGDATFAQFGTWSSLFAVHLTNVVVNGTTAAAKDTVTITFTVDGSTASLSGDAAYFVTNDYFESGTYRDASITIMTGAWECENCQIHVDDVLACDLWPCIDDNGVVCMYDKVNSVYYYNAGTGEFEAGFPPVFFRRRPKVSTAKPVAVTITGTGNSTRCYTTINGTTYTAAANGIEVMAGDAIAFCYWSSYFATGTLTIDGITIGTATANKAATYDWTVPNGITKISITLAYANIGSNIAGNITVTTS